jgi:hypothetical protein
MAGFIHWKSNLKERGACPWPISYGVTNPLSADPLFLGWFYSIIEYPKNAWQQTVASCVILTVVSRAGQWPKSTHPVFKGFDHSRVTF